MRAAAPFSSHEGRACTHTHTQTTPCNNSSLPFLFFCNSLLKFLLCHVIQSIKLQRISFPSFTWEQTAALLQPCAAFLRASHLALSYAGQPIMERSRESSYRYLLKKATPHRCFLGLCSLVRSFSLLVASHDFLVVCTNGIVIHLGGIEHVPLIGQSVPPSVIHSETQCITRSSYCCFSASRLSRVFLSSSSSCCLSKSR